MIIVDTSKKGRVYLSRSELQRVVKNYIKENYSKINCCYAVFSENHKLTLGLKIETSLRMDEIYALRRELISELNNHFHYDVKKIDIKILN